MSFSAVEDEMDVRKRENIVDGYVSHIAKYESFLVHTSITLVGNPDT